VDDVANGVRTFGVCAVLGGLIAIPYFGLWPLVGVAAMAILALIVLRGVLGE